MEGSLLLSLQCICWYKLNRTKNTSPWQYFDFGSISGIFFYKILYIHIYSSQYLFRLYIPLDHKCSFFITTNSSDICVQCVFKTCRQSWNFQINSLRSESLKHTHTYTALFLYRHKYGINYQKIFALFSAINYSDTLIGLGLNWSAWL